MDKILLSRLVKGFATPENDCYINHVTSDSRDVVENSVFLALRGERVNGENYAAGAIEKGAKFVVTENYIDKVPDNMQAIVPNILDASIQMGTNVRDTYDIDVIGVTGSMGKTTTKEFIYAAISPFAKTVKTQGNRNNELGMPKTIYGFTKEKTEEKIKELVEKFDLNSVLQRKAGKLSGGMQRRVSIAMAIICEPKILFLDEPTLGIDVIARHELWQTILSLKGKVTIILTTHYMEEAEALSDRIGIMKNGRLLALGTVNELNQRTGFTNFEDTFVSIVKGDNA